jgi:pyruvate/2-oxoglutarate dehydrogenase complex dihydrolipoamide dehydrogenase (E3) component
VVQVGIQFLMKKNKVDVHHGLGSFVDAHTVKVTKADGSATDIQGKNIIIATGSKPASLPFISIDKKRIITSTEALKMKEIPKHLIVIGGGVIGMELGSVYGRLGAKVSVVEYMDSIIPTMDKSLGKELQKSLKKIGFEFFLKHKVTGVENLGKEVVVKAENAKGETVEIKGDYVLVSIGRKAYTDGLNAAAAGVKVTDRGQIEVNDHLQTAVPHIYAIGDVVKGAMLAHKAEEEGVFVAETIAGQKPHINYLLIPGVVYTWPEVAAVGNGGTGATSLANAAIVTYTGVQTLTNKTITNLVFDGNYTEDVYAIVDGASVDLNPANGTVQTWTLGASRSPTATSFAAGQSLTLMIDDGTAYSITWPSVTWKTNLGVAPTLNATGFTAIQLWKVNSTLYGARVGDA